MIEDPIVGILRDGCFHAQEQLATALRVSLSNIEQRLQKLQMLGLEIEVDSNLGCRLSPAILLLDRAQILAGLPDFLRESLRTFDIHLTVDSTNSEAMRYLKGGSRGKALFLAEKQEIGRGRRGRNWVSPMARNIYMTLVWPVAGSPQTLDGVSLVTALSLVRALQDSGLKGMEKLRVKWPNDVWLDNRKLAGILLELHRPVDAGGAQQLVIGLGINVDMPSAEWTAIDQAATDLVSHGNKGADRNKIISRVLAQLDSDLEQFMESGFACFRAQWQQLDMYYEKEVEVLTGNDKTTGTVKGVSNNGALVLQTKSGDKMITGGEVAPSIRVASSDS